MSKTLELNLDFLRNNQHIASYALYYYAAFFYYNKGYKVNYELLYQECKLFVERYFVKDTDNTNKLLSSLNSEFN